MKRLIGQERCFRLLPPHLGLWETGGTKRKGRNKNKPTVEWHKLQCPRWLLQTSSQRKSSNCSIFSVEKVKHQTEKVFWDGSNPFLPLCLCVVPYDKWRWWTGRFSRWSGGGLCGRGRGTFLRVTLGEPAPVSAVTPTQPAGLTDSLLIHLHHGKTQFNHTERGGDDDDKHGVSLTVVITITQQQHKCCIHTAITLSPRWWPHTLTFCSLHTICSPHCPFLFGQIWQLFVYTRPSLFL